MPSVPENELWRGNSIYEAINSFYELWAINSYWASPHVNLSPSTVTSVDHHYSPWIGSWLSAIAIDHLRLYIDSSSRTISNIDYYQYHNEFNINNIIIIINIISGLTINSPTCYNHRTDRVFVQRYDKKDTQSISPFVTNHEPSIQFDEKHNPCFTSTMIHLWLPQFTYMIHSNH